MYSQEKRCIYRKNQLAEVICQLRFPEILTIAAKLPVDFQEAIRREFPQYSVHQDDPVPRVVGTNGNLSFQKQEPVTNYQFASADGSYRVNLTSTFISLTCSHYTCWEDFAKWLDRPLAEFIQIYAPAYFERIGLRYLNFFSRKALELEEIPFRELFSPCYLGPLMEEDQPESAVGRCSVDTEMGIRGGCRLRLHAGPGLVRRPGKPDPELKFIFDQDLYMPGQVAPSHAAGALQALHSQAYPIFRGAVTDTLHHAMEPDFE